MNWFTTTLNFVSDGRKWVLNKENQAAAQKTILFTKIEFPLSHFTLALKEKRKYKCEKESESESEGEEKRKSANLCRLRFSF